MGRRIAYDHDRWRELYDAGWNDTAIARDCGASHSTVTWWRIKHGLPSIARNASALSPAQEQARRALYDAGLDDREITARLGLGPTTMRGWRCRHKLPARRRRRSQHDERFSVGAQEEATAG